MLLRITCNCWIDEFTFSDINKHKFIATEMSNNFIDRFCHKYFQKNPKKSKEEVIKKLTHLYLNGRKLEEIVCTNIYINVYLLN